MGRLLPAALAGLLSACIAEERSEDVMWTWKTSASASCARGLAVRSDGVSLVSIVDGDTAALVALSSDGAELWRRTLVESGFIGISSLVLDADDNLYVAGSLADTVDFGAGPIEVVGDSDGFVARYDAGGALDWAYVPGGESQDYPLGLDVFDDGSLLFTLRYYDAVDVAGDHFEAASDADVLFIRLEANGDVRWVTPFDNPGQEVDAVAAAPDGTTVIGGNFRDTLYLPVEFMTVDDDDPQERDLFVARLDALGRFEAAEQLDQTQLGWMTDLAIAPTGDILAVEETEVISVSPDLGEATLLFPWPTVGDEPVSMTALLAGDDGRLHVTAFRRADYALHQGGTKRWSYLVTYDAPDGEGHVRLVDFGRHASLSRVALDPEGHVVVAGCTTGEDASAITDDVEAFVARVRVD